MLGPEQRKELEARITADLRAERYDSATTQALEGYGPEILGYLVAVARDEGDANDAFSLFSEDLWKGLPSFRAEASVRTWAYAIARNALNRLRRDPHRRAGKRVGLSQSPEVRALADRVRTQTLPYLRTDVKDKVAELRQELDPDDQTLFIMRISRGMSWLDIARVMGGDLDDREALKREAARLRKRFERAKAELAQKVRERGIVGDQ